MMIDQEIDKIISNALKEYQEGCKIINKKRKDL